MGKLSKIFVVKIAKIFDKFFFHSREKIRGLKARKMVLKSKKHDFIFQKHRF